MTSRFLLGLVRVAAGLALAAAAGASALANDALKGTWVGKVGANAVTLTIDSAQAGTLTGSVKGGVSLTYTVSGGPPSAANAKGSFQGNSVTLKTPGGTWAMQLQGNQLNGTYTPDSTGSRARAATIELTKR
jgi:hypothetical protein